MNNYKYYQATVRYSVPEITATGKTQLKTKRDQYLVNAESITSAQQTLTATLGSLYDNFEIIAIKQSIIRGVITEVQDVLAE